MRALALVAVLLLAQVPAFGAVESWTLDEGTTVALVEDHRAPIVTIRLVFPAGTWSPWVRRSHAQEAFELQLRDPKTALRQRAQALAADIDLSMGSRNAGLRANFLREDLDAVSSLIRDVLANRDYDRRELIARGRGEKIAWGLSSKQPQFRLGHAAAQRLFEPGDPRRWRWERPEPVERDSAKLAAARDALIRLPGRVIGFAGAISREEAERIARDLVPPVSPETPADLAPQLDAIREKAGADDNVPIAKLTQVYLWWVRPSLPWTDPDDPAFLIADHVLGGHFYSRLYVALRHEGGETYGASSWSDGDVAPATYALNTFTKSENAGKTEAKLRGVLVEMHAKGISDEERSAAASFLLGRRAFSKQSPEQILATWLRERMLGLPAGWFDERAERAATLSLDEVNEFIRRWYDPASFTLLKAVPKP